MYVWDDIREKKVQKNTKDNKMSYGNVHTVFAALETPTHDEP